MLPPRVKKKKQNKPKSYYEKKNFKWSGLLSINLLEILLKLFSFLCFSEHYETCLLSIWIFFTLYFQFDYL